MNRYRLLSGSAIVAVAGMLSAPAMAFNDVDWQWDLRAYTNIYQDIYVSVDFDPTGLVAVEDLQIQIGDVVAESYVSNVQNNRPNGEGSTQVIDLGELTLELNASATGLAALDGDATVSIAGGPNDGFTETLDDDVPLSINPSLSEQATFDLGELVVDIPGDPVVLDAALELPEVVSTATAVGNNESIETTVKTDVHSAQVLFGTGRGGDFSSVLSTLSFLTPAQVSATSQVNDILNATVDSSATAVGNLKTIDVAAATPDDAILVADVKQLSYADVSSLSNVYNVAINDYNNLVAIDRPLVSSVATSIGNNLSVTVSSPVGD